MFSDESHGRRAGGARERRLAPIGAGRKAPTGGDGVGAPTTPPGSRGHGQRATSIPPHALRSRRRRRRPGRPRTARAAPRPRPARPRSCRPGTPDPTLSQHSHPRHAVPARGRLPRRGRTRAPPDRRVAARAGGVVAASQGLREQDHGAHVHRPGAVELVGRHLAESQIGAAGVDRHDQVDGGSRRGPGRAARRPSPAPSRRRVPRPRRPRWRAAPRAGSRRAAARARPSSRRS